MNVARDVLRTAPRLASVLGLLARHGFASLLRGQARWPGPLEVREALERLGVVFMKLGQVLSTRRDILPPEYVAEASGRRRGAMRQVCNKLGSSLVPPGTRTPQGARPLR